MKHLVVILCLFFLVEKSKAQSIFADTMIKSIKTWQKELNHQFTSDESPLTKEARKAFKAHSFFDIDTNFIITAHFVKNDTAKSIKLPTTGPIKMQWLKYGWLKFSVNKDTFKIPVFKNIDPIYADASNNSLFLLFGDNTNSHNTYGGGRYIDLPMPDASNKVVIDFNKAYNPYCAYSKGYSCPIVPATNYLPLSINAGVKFEYSH